MGPILTENCLEQKSVKIWIWSKNCRNQPWAEIGKRIFQVKEHSQFNFLQQYLEKKPQTEFTEKCLGPKSGKVYFFKTYSLWVQRKGKKVSNAWANHNRFRGNLRRSGGARMSL
jgi:hypothetical protein